METLPTRWFELSPRELKALLFAACAILFFLGGLNVWNRAVYTEEFEIHNSSESLPTPERIDINAAPAYELQFLPGIGPARAQDIIEHREQHGPFEHIEELQDIRGIGPATVKNIRPLAICSQPE